MDSVCYNGDIIKKNDFSISVENRAFRYGDSFFETIKCYKGKPLFWQEHYFRIAGAFCLMHMLPPSNFQIENFQSMINDLLLKNNLDNDSARVRISFFRNKGGYYFPLDNKVNFIIESENLDSYKYSLNKKGIKAILYKDNVLSKNSINNIKSNNKLINILASIYAKNNNYDDCLLINIDKNLVESTSGNIFIIKKNIIKTPPLEDGCVDGVMRKILLNDNVFNIQESSISFSDLFNSDEVFITNVICGIKWIRSIKNNIYKNNNSNLLIESLNTKYLV